MGLGNLGGALHSQIQEVFRPHWIIEYKSKVDLLNLHLRLPLKIHDCLSWNDQKRFVHCLRQRARNQPIRHCGYFVLS